MNALLTELDGAQDRTGIYVVGTTNRPDMIDPAMLRPGRLNLPIFVDLPTEDERVDILRAICRTRTDEFPEKELDRLVRVAKDARCQDFSGADLGALHTTAAENALKRWGRQQKAEPLIDDDDWEYALAKTRRSVTDPGRYRKLAATWGS